MVIRLIFPVIIVDIIGKVLTIVTTHCYTIMYIPDYLTLQNITYVVYIKGKKTLKHLMNVRKLE